jgi:hypothetical protein
VQLHAVDWFGLVFLSNSVRVCSVGLAYEMMNSAKSPWKPLICNFPDGYGNFLQMQSFEELERATAEIRVVNPAYNATIGVGNEIKQTALNIHGIVAAVVALFPAVFPSGLPAKYFMHARMAVVSRAWGSDGNSVLCPIADLFNHQEPTHVAISIRKDSALAGDSNLSVVEVVLERTAAKGEEVFNGTFVLQALCWTIPPICTAAYSRNTCIPRFVLNFGKSLPMVINNCGRFIILQATRPWRRETTPAFNDTHNRKTGTLQSKLRTPANDSCTLKSLRASDKLAFWLIFPDL